MPKNNKYSVNITRIYKKSHLLTNHKNMRQTVCSFGPIISPCLGENTFSVFLVITLSYTVYIPRKGKFSRSYETTSSSNGKLSKTV